ncbi:MAG: prolyl oligopeptidase family serine peptidase [Mariniblastus sp.]|nr:prolyl oligopeptidase family serine peptidase [Mariniblastus sp.]
MNQIVIMPLISFVLAIALMTTSGFAQEKMVYPKTKRVDQIDNFFGTPVSDPFRWLEEDVRKSDEVRAWVDAQNQVTFAAIEKLPYRKEIESRLTELWDYEKYGVPFRRGDRFFYYKNDGLQNQSVLYKLETLDAKPEVLVDPNQWSADGTDAMGGMAFSDNGELMAYGIQKAGSDWRSWKVMEVESGRDLSDELNWIKFGGVSWTKDSKGFYYSCYDAPKSGEKFQGLNLGQKVYYHKIGDNQKDDQLIHSNPENPKWGFLPSVTEDGRYLVITVWQGTDDRYRILYRDLESKNSDLTVLIDNFENEYSFIGNEGSKFYFKSDFEAPKKCILVIDVNDPAKENWQVVVPEAEEAMESAGIVGGYLILDHLKDAKTQIKLYDLNGKYEREVDFPGIGSAGGFGGRRDHTETFYSFSSFNQPPSIYRYDLKSGKSTLIRRAKVDFNPDDFEVKQVFYTSKDGTKVPMFIAHKKGLVLDGTNPTLLYAYGGFNISLTPSFSIQRLQWMEMGGVFAMPNLRGGGEYGKEWHKAGTKTKKQNVFDDFIAAGEYLIENKYTSSNNLGIQGGSNGGLLVGACMTQRPDLYGACLPAVGVMDMLRFHKFTAGRFWVDDYGCADESKQEFEALNAYSPYHNLVDGTSYPATMVTTADTDDRVVPGHSFKFAARLQEAHDGPNPVLIRIESKAGHGAGKPTAKIIEEVADQWAFLAKHLGLEPDLPTGQ